MLGGSIKMRPKGGKAGGQSDALRVMDPRSGCAGRRLGAVRECARDKRAQLGTAPELLLWELQQTLGRVRRKVNYDIGQPGNALRLRQPRSGGDCQCPGAGSRCARTPGK